MEFEPGAYDGAVWEVAAALVRADECPLGGDERRRWAGIVRRQIFDLLGRDYDIEYMVPEEDATHAVEAILMATSRPPVRPLWDRQLWSWLTACRIVDVLEPAVTLVYARQGGEGKHPKAGRTVPWRSAVFESVGS
jgi:hypothetical protein